MFGHIRKENWNMSQLERFMENGIGEDSKRRLLTVFHHGMERVTTHELIHVVGDCKT